MKKVSFGDTELIKQDRKYRAEMEFIDGFRELIQQTLGEIPPHRLGTIIADVLYEEMIHEAEFFDAENFERGFRSAMKRKWDYWLK